MLKISTSPHVLAKTTTRKIMRDVIIALLPAVFVAVAMFGVSALVVLMTSVASCVLFEYLISRYAFHKENTTYDLSAVITGILLALNLPSSMPVWMTMLGAFMAIGVAKMAFGGLGKNIFNPALVGRVFLFISFPVQMTTWPKPDYLNFWTIDAETAATPLGVLKHLGNDGMSVQLPSYLQMFLGETGGSMGEMSALALLIGLSYMLYRKIIRWYIPVYYIGSFMLLITISWLINRSVQFAPMIHLLSGGLLLGAFFMATDYTTSPMTKKGKIIFAVGCGVLTYIIRIFGSYPEGVSFAILIMNAFVPLIDRHCPSRVYGTGRK